MNKMQKKVATVYSQVEISSGIFDLWLSEEEIANSAQPGQFIGVYCNQDSRLLPRPISICEIDEVQGRIRIVYRVVGGGTNEISHFNKDDKITILGPLGNGFTLNNRTSVLIAGGIGIPPMLELAKQLQGDKHIILGYRSETFLVEELSKYGKVYIATEDGSAGTKGNVVDILRTLSIKMDDIYACGPKPMLKAVKDYAIANKVDAQLSVEEKMACGIGACLGCVCKTKDNEGNIVRKRVCKDGPVFKAEEVEL
ncbi:MAG: 2-polyprenylphenol hydroxylase and related flavodoxin oxidoreductase [Clostridiales bacterium]|jgi:dihydroorotate dehydrogenase electron transfer subunit|nr:2-polyprenylphenol hydroxylase and related flavodoxin oxidoreductase [Clostridiales bacterium]